MRNRSIQTWKDVADDQTKLADFAVTISDIDFEATFISRASFASSDDAGHDFLPGLISDLDGITVEIDPRTQQNPLPVMPQIRIDENVFTDIFGGVFPEHPTTLKVEIALYVYGLAWEDRIIVFDGGKIDPTTINHGADGTLSFSLFDPLNIGNVKLPPNLIDVSKLPTSWNTSYIQDNVNGMPFPICYGTIHRSSPIKIYDDGGAAAADDTLPIRRYILCGHLCSAITATVHRTSWEIAAPQSGGYGDVGEFILTERVVGGPLFSYIQTSGGDEDPTLSPPKEAQAISFEATEGVRGSIGGIIREMIREWTDIEIDETLERSMSDVTEALRSLTMSVMINGEGTDRSNAREIIDQRFSTQLPIGVARVGGNLMLLPLMATLAEPGFGYHDPVAEINLGVDCHLMTDIRETGTIINQFEAHYKRRENGQFESIITLDASNDNESARSESLYGRRESGSINMHDVSDNGTANSILKYLRNVHLWPWYEADIFAPFEYSYLMSGLKVRINHSEESRIATSCPRIRHNLKASVANSWRDAFIIRTKFSRLGLIFTVIF